MIANRNQQISPAVGWISNTHFKQDLQEYSLFRHPGVFKDVHVDEKSLLVFTHAAQQQSAFLQQAWAMENKVKRHK